MKLFGQITELVAAIFRKDSQALTLRPSQTVTYTAARDIQLPAQDADSVLVSRTSTDTLTNKTLTAPTLTAPVLGTPASGTLTNATGLPLTTGVTGILPVANGGTGVTSSTGTGSTVLSASPTFTGTPVLATPTATSASITGTGGAGFLELAEQSATPSSPASTKLRVYGKTSDEGLYFLNSSGTEKQVGSGSGEKNYLATGANTAAGWTASGAGITVTTDVTGSDLPRPNTTGTGIKFTGVSGSTAYAYYRFILDDADANKKLKLVFDMKPGTAVASDFKVDVYSNTASDYSTGNARLPLSTDSSSVSALPALTGTYRTTFDAPAVSAKYIEVRIGMNASATHTLVLSDFIVGPGVVVQGAAVTGWSTYTPAITASTSNPTKGTTTVDSASWRRVGDSIELHYIYKQSGAGSAGSGVYRFALPTGLTINSSVVSNLGSVPHVLGSAVADPGTSGSTALTGFVSAPSAANATYLELWAGDDASNVAAVQSGTADLSNTTTNYSFFAVVPVNEYAGSGTVNVVQNDVEYASNDGSGGTTANTTYSTGMQYGPAGQAFPNVAITSTTTATNTAYKVSFHQPISATDRIDLELSIDSGVTWGLIGQLQAGSFGSGFQGALPIGMNWTKNDATSILVQFSNAGRVSSATYGTAASTWSLASNFLWRVRKVAGGQAVGFSEATTTSLGLVKPSHTANGASAASYSSGSGLVRSGTYTPSYVNVANTTAAVVTANSMIWSQVGQVVTCHGYIQVTVTAAAPTDTAFTMTLPVTPTSNFASSVEASGTVAYVGASTAINPGEVYANSGAKTVSVEFAASNSGTSRQVYYSFSYVTN
jgi:hypothetical protein